MNNDANELSDSQFKDAISNRVRRRLIEGRVESGEDVSALRRFVHMTPVEFAEAFGISQQTLLDWEGGKQVPEGPALCLIRITARHPGVLRENLRPVA
jgi:putative transcriptional regulator